MSVSRTFLERVAAGTGYQIGALEKVIRLGELAGDIGRHALLGTVLTLKGGTALNLCFGAPARLSVDLDYNYVGQTDRAKMEAERPRVEAAVEHIAKGRGYRVQHSSDAHAGRKLYLAYRSALGHMDRIEVDLNFLYRVPVGAPERRRLWQPEGLDRPEILAVSVDELCAGKVLALLDRGAARDAWDAVRLPQIDGAALHSKLFRGRLIALSAVLDHPLDTYSRERLLDRITERAVAEQLVQMLADGQAPAAAVLAEQAWVVVGPLVTLSETEREYVTAMHAGEARMSLLFPDDHEEAGRMSGHPAIQWKLLNVKGYKATKRG